MYYEKAAWDEMRQRLIDEKLEKLGVVGKGPTGVPEIHAPHARAASVSVTLSFRKSVR